MRITIPVEYRNKFKYKVYVVRWKDHSILLFAENEYENLLGSINALEGIETGLKRFLEEGLAEILVKDNAIEAPFDNWLQEKERIFENTENGLLVR